MECEFCDCTRNIRLPGKPITTELHINKENEKEGKLDEFIDIGRLRLNRKKQKEGIEGLRNIIGSSDNSDRTIDKLKSVFAGAAISGIFAIFYDLDSNSKAYFRIKNIPDTAEARRLLGKLGLVLDDTVDSMKMTARNSLAYTDKRSNIV